METTLTGFLVFCLAAGFTPGPNNLMLATSGANFGMRRTLPHLSGVIIGYPILMIATGAGVAGLFSRFPALHDVLVVTGSLYLLWLAWRIAFASALSPQEGSARPLTFWQAVAFQWVNPKGWLMAVTAMTVYVDADANRLLQVPLLALIAGIVTIFATSTWAIFGVAMSRAFESRPRVFRAFNIMMGVLLVGSLYTLV
ncbi:MAG TPA: LysE family translocator [Gammaproteobacteria bacterium]